MKQSNFWQKFINKQVTFRYMRQELQFNLSQSLFSSAGVDIGSRFLLRTLAKNIEISELNSVLDIGCGVGVLGLSLKKANPNIQLIAQDRDALAVTFTAQNAILNDMGFQTKDKPPEPVEGKGRSGFDKLNLRLVVHQTDETQAKDMEGIVVQGGLAFAGIGDQKFDLIVSNLPGKAGHSVLQNILQQMPEFLSESGLAAVVIVKPLAGLVTETLAEMESEVLLREEASGYEVFHFRGGNDLTRRRRGAEKKLKPYIRNEQVFKVGRQKMGMKTAWNMPEFDSLTHDTALAVNALKKKPVTGRVLFWNPRQGHLPMYLHEQASEVVLAGRDVLSLRIAELNLREAGAENISSQHVPYFLEISGGFDWIIIFPDNDPGVAWEYHLLPHCRSLLASGGQVLLVAKSAYTHRLLQKKKGLNSKFDRKRNGYRAVILAKK